MDFDQAVTRRGKVIEQLPRAMVRVELEDLSRVLAHVTARRNKDFLRLLPGDAVEVELSPLDPGRGRVIRKTT
ncbi:MAG: translation initiation factor IF-1 [Acidobacteria bacterium]|nr:translation initiation factor IF-1 [Acidobacteriota bacterium]